MTGDARTQCVRLLAELLDRKTTERESAAAARQFVQLLESEGLLAKSKDIIFEAEQLFWRQSDLRELVIETAREVNVTRLKAVLGKEKCRVSHRLNPALVAGARMVINGSVRLDLSLERMLEETFVGKF